MLPGHGWADAGGRGAPAAVVVPSGRSVAADEAPAVPLPLTPPVLPQLARPAAALPDGEGYAYEPKWDGFRAIVFVDGDESCSSRATASS